MRFPPNNPPPPSAPLPSPLNSYIIFNTAVSKEWGFPQTCPPGCPCKNYDCLSPSFDDKCGFNPGFCPMLQADSAHMKVSWVRVYQDPENSVHKVGCSTPERPTRRWIEGNERNYMKEGDKKPLKEVPKGGGECEVGVGRCCDSMGEVRCFCPSSDFLARTS